MGKEYKEAIELLDQINHVEEIDCSGKSYGLRDELEDIVGLACGHCGNTVTDNELREILCTPEYVLS